ncbi:unnamed protein product [Vitrella brassicaformis CCMP3155]|uniref:Peptidase A1 domain-containing protein n=2 Tax=Vitrella brassicaformis TaxID=1169539 RepID=A0A0G4EMM2_VITBC|nr:unnamed protein product [Vitrella brassicaformis CCMP3155]|eukprot:CEL98262.1 unnamed protein product [Vitrella brassicaformis CCMP3155]
MRPINKRLSLPSLFLLILSWPSPHRICFARDAGLDAGAFTSIALPIEQRVNVPLVHQLITNETLRAEALRSRFPAIFYNSSGGSGSNESFSFSFPSPSSLEETSPHHGEKGKADKDKKPTREVLSVANYDDLEYSSTIHVEGRSFVVTVDTGSSYLWLPGKDCRACADVDHDIGCDECAGSSRLPDCTNPLNEPVDLHYVSGRAKGALCKGKVALGAFELTEQVYAHISRTDHAFADGTSSDGVLGLGFRDDTGKSYPTVMESIVAHKLLDRPTISFILTSGGRRGSQLVLGSPPWTSRFAYPLPVLDRAHWMVRFTSVSGYVPNLEHNKVERRPLPVATRAIVDTGSSLIHTPTDPLAFPLLLQNIAPPELELLTTGCTNVKPHVPNTPIHCPCHNTHAWRPFSFDIWDVTFTIGPNEYFIPGLNDEEDETSCTLGVVSTDVLGGRGGEGVWLLGDVFLKKWASTFDFGMRTVAFSGSFPGGPCDKDKKHDDKDDSSGGFSIEGWLNKQESKQCKGEEPEEPKELEQLENNVTQWLRQYGPYILAGVSTLVVLAAIAYFLHKRGPQPVPDTLPVVLSYRTPSVAPLASYEAPPHSSVPSSAPPPPPSLPPPSYISSTPPRSPPPPLHKPPTPRAVTFHELLGEENERLAEEGAVLLYAVPVYNRRGDRNVPWRACDLVYYSSTKRAWCRIEMAYLEKDPLNGDVLFRGVLPYEDSDVGTPFYVIDRFSSDRDHPNAFCGERERSGALDGNYYSLLSSSINTLRDGDLQPLDRLKEVGVFLYFTHAITIVDRTAAAMAVPPILHYLDERDDQWKDLPFAFSGYVTDSGFHQTNGRYENDDNVTDADQPEWHCQWSVLLPDIKGLSFVLYLPRHDDPACPSPPAPLAPPPTDGHSPNAPPTAQHHRPTHGWFRCDATRQIALRPLAIDPSEQSHRSAANGQSRALSRPFHEGLLSFAFAPLWVHTPDGADYRIIYAGTYAITEEGALLEVSTQPPSPPAPN